ncbi:MAG TPA: trypsin-like peptidase domain-containing protein [Pirellulaceae bacterium]|nr:trypsin-like peptidase domain-containing protein [Pirellulaceae bacterium]
MISSLAMLTKYVKCPLLLIAVSLFVTTANAATTYSDTIDEVQPKLVKIYGAGGVRGLEAYQSGLLISTDGYVLTVFSYVLDSDVISVTLNDGRKFTAELVGADPRLEIALLKIKATELRAFNLDAAVEIGAGDRVLAFSNLYGVATGNEPASVLHGMVSAKTNLAARRGAFQTPYQGQVYVLDAMTNNPGAAGGALTDRNGRLVGLLGKELRNSLNNTWLNYALPIPELVVAVEDIKAGKTRPRSAASDVKRPLEAHSPATLGVRLVPDILAKTPPFIDRVERGSFADKAGLRPDDLVLFVNGRIVSSCKMLIEELAIIDRDDPVKLLIERESELIEVTLPTVP